VITIIIYNLKHVELVVSLMAFRYVQTLISDRDSIKCLPYSVARSQCSLQWSGDVGTKWSFSGHFESYQFLHLYLLAPEFPSECL